MKYCEKCGKELLDEAVVCPGCGCAVKAAPQKEDSKYGEVSYDAAVSSVNTMLWSGSACLVIGIIVFLAVSIYVGTILCVAAAVLFSMPMKNLRKAVKEKCGADKEAFKAEFKRINAQISEQNSTYRTLNVLRIVAAIVGVITIFLW